MSWRVSAREAEPGPLAAAAGGCCHTRGSDSGRTVPGVASLGTIFGGGVGEGVAEGLESGMGSSAGAVVVDGGEPASFEIANIVNDPAQGRYIAYNAGGAEMGWLGYRMENGVLVVWTTRTDPGFRGHGVADQLTRRALDDAVADGTPIDPVCWYASEWVHRNPKYARHVTDPGF